MVDHDLLTTNEAMAYLSIARSTLYRWVKEGRLPAYYTPTGAGRRYRREELRAVLVRVEAARLIANGPAE